MKFELRLKGVQYMMIFPAKLKVLAEGLAWFFLTPEAAMDWLEGWHPTEPKKSKKHSDSLRPDQRQDQSRDPGRSSPYTVDNLLSCLTTSILHDAAH